MNHHHHHHQHSLQVCPAYPVPLRRRIYQSMADGTAAASRQSVEARSGLVRGREEKAPPPANPTNSGSWRPSKRPEAGGRWGEELMRSWRRLQSWLNLAPVVQKAEQVLWTAAQQRDREMHWRRRHSVLKNLAEKKKRPFSQALIPLQK